MKGDYTTANNMMNQIVQEIHIKVEKSQKSSNNNCDSTNNINLMDEKKCNKKLAKIHGHKSNKKYKKLLKSYDPILNNNELVKALSDPEDKIGINDKLFDALGTKMSSKAEHCGDNDKSEASFTSTPTPNGIKFSILRAANSSTMKSLKIPIIFKDQKLCDTSNIKKLPNDNKLISTDSSEMFDKISRNESIQASSSKVEIQTANFSSSNNVQECSYSEQASHLKPTTEVDCAASPITIDNYHYENTKDFLKLQKIIFKFDLSRTDAFKKLVCIIKKTFNCNLQRLHKINYRWHSPEIRVIQILLKELLQEIDQTANKIIHFLTLLNILFRKSVDTYKMSIRDVYYSFFGFTDFIKRCLLSHDNKMAMEWIPMVWNNCFYYSLILVEYILFSITKRNLPYKSIQTLFEWSYVPDVEKLLKILTYDNRKRSASIKFATDDINSYLKQRPIQSEYQDMPEEPLNKKRKFTSYEQEFQQAQQPANLKVTIDENSVREAQVILSSIGQKMYDDTQ
ncbi:uncharacterized protein LOC111033871 [Myzus persicae]|uniref:uncharacterized protein LOC111033871 n=1 Tax=Myzus persicae TaxID=13164 RepID=UPI000B939E6F|nr:uncharacterized protein LOC111033871 [Myzus persicae]